MRVEVGVRLLGPLLVSGDIGDNPGLIRTERILDEEGGKLLNVATTTGGGS